MAPRFKTSGMTVRFSRASASELEALDLIVACSHELDAVDPEDRVLHRRRCVGGNGKVAHDVPGK